MAHEIDGPNITQTNTKKHVEKAQKGWTSLSGFLDKFNNDWSMMFAGSLAYSLLTAIVPILLAILSVLGFVLGQSTVDYVTDHLILGSNLALNEAVKAQIKFVIAQLHREAGII